MAHVRQVERKPDYINYKWHVKMLMNFVYKLNILYKKKKKRETRNPKNYNTISLHILLLENMHAVFKLLCFNFYTSPCAI